MSSKPSDGPTNVPSINPSQVPSILPSKTPSMSPSTSSKPSGGPTNVPSIKPSQVPSIHPSKTPSISPSTSTKPSSTPSFLPSQAPSDNVCTPLPFVEGIVIDEDGRVVDITGITTTTTDTVTGSQCTASSYTAVVETLITSTFSNIGQWDPNNSAGKGITIDNDAVSDATTSAALVVGGSNSKQVVVRDQTFDAQALAGLSSRARSALLDPSSSATFCRSTFVANAIYCVNSFGSLNIVDSTLEGVNSYYGLSLSGSNTVIVGKNTKILAGGGIAIAFLSEGGSVDIHEGIFGDGTETYSLAVQGGTANIYGGEWKSSLASIGGDGVNYINLYHKANDPSLLCDGNTVPNVEIDGGTIPNYLECPQDYSVPTFPECE